MEKEIYKNIPGYEGSYMVSNYGNVKSLNYLNTKQERLLKQSFDSYGYCVVGLSKDGKTKSMKVHQLVAMVFHNWNKETHPLIKHLNHIKTDNNMYNLEPGTIRENSTDWRKDVGINWNKTKRKFVAQIQFFNNKIHLGYFNTKEDALAVYKKAVENIHLYNGDNKEFRNKLIDEQKD